MKHQISICLTDIGELVKQNHPAVTVSQKNGKKYINLDLWFNEEPDQYQKNIQVKVYNKDTKESKFVGNGKQYQEKPTPPAQQETFDKLDKGDKLPF